ncbi:MAG: hypothetical protein CO188_11620 [Zetaproteobacteria bacterium CG_4_9_14_3_um_filter_54_145]|nr:MAG: hypothetical protein CO188_11620 [Zetaproteobacteria bacterium CG_4_9_14_3_um_filter_54_145]
MISEFSMRCVERLCFMQCFQHVLRGSVLLRGKVDHSKSYVLIVDDDEFFRSSLEETISRHSQLMLSGSFSSCREAKKHLSPAHQVMLIDIGMRDGGAADLIHHLKKVSPQSEVIVITSIDDKHSIIEAVRAGITGYLLKKDATPAHIAACVIETLEGGAVISPVIARRILYAFIPHEKYLKCTPQNNLLTSREQEILGFVARGYSREEIASIAGISVHTVVAHSRNIYKKLHHCCPVKDFAVIK